MAGIADMLAELSEEEVYRLVREQLDIGTDPMSILNECRQGMDTVGERYKSGDYFLSELIVSGEIFKESMKLIEPHLQAGAETDQRARVVLATVKGDTISARISLPYSSKGPDSRCMTWGQTLSLRHLSTS